MSERVYSAEEAYAILASESEASASDSDPDFDPANCSETSLDTLSTLADVSSDVSDADPGPPPASRRRTAPAEEWVVPHHQRPYIPPFTANPGINIDVAGFTATQFLQVFMGDDLLGHIVAQSNLYAHQHCAAKPDSYLARQQWTPLDVPEFLKFWALTMLMGIIEKPSIRSYWSCSPICSTPIYPQSMSRRRYENILRFMHFSDNSLCPPREHPQFDRLYKIRRLITHFAASFAEAYTPGRNICMDESLMKYKGRLGFTHTRRNLHAVDPHQFSNLLHHLPHTSSFTCPDAATNHYNTTLISALDTLAPLRLCKAPRRQLQPWHTLQTRYLQRCSRTAERAWRKSRSEADFVHFKFILRSYTSALHLAKQSFFSSLIYAVLQP
uniref:PiggyBac transposable element-derived protein domain-containing protein n=1 Tax=Leptobrachium leishanense TaxID=445787 RepID=A0A8C5QF35_9ANUR